MLLVGLAHFLRVLSLEAFGSVRVPDVFSMTEGGVKDAALAVEFAPCYRKIAGRVVFRIFVQKQQAVDFAAVKAVEQINLFFIEVPAWREMAARGMRLARDDALNRGRRNVMLESGAHHVAQRSEWRVDGGG